MIILDSLPISYYDIHFKSSWMVILDPLPSWYHNINFHDFDKFAEANYTKKLVLRQLIIHPDYL